MGDGELLGLICDDEGLETVGKGSEVLGVIGLRISSTPPPTSSRMPRKRSQVEMRRMLIILPID